jgi:hypothetical protein
MPRPQLRIYYGPEKTVTAEKPVPAEGQFERITVPLCDVFPLLGDAVRSERTWLQDFADEEITISSDLYEVLLAYQHHCRRPSA